jgi:hypothetical protein
MHAETGSRQTAATATQSKILIIRAITIHIAKKIPQILILFAPENSEEIS